MTPEEIAEDPVVEAAAADAATEATAGIVAAATLAATDAAQEAAAREAALIERLSATVKDQVQTEVTEWHTRLAAVETEHQQQQSTTVEAMDLQIQQIAERLSALEAMTTAVLNMPTRQEMPEPPPPPNPSSAAEDPVSSIVETLSPEGTGVKGKRASRGWL